MDREWASSDKVGALYITVRDKNVPDHFQPPKDCYMSLCVEHTGDNHYCYRRVHLVGHLMYLGKEFHRYGGGHKEAKPQLTKRQFHLLMAGEVIRYDHKRNSRTVLS